jgi:hypothetical protein
MVGSRLGRSRSRAGVDHRGVDNLLRAGLRLAKSRFDCVEPIARNGKGTRILRARSCQSVQPGSLPHRRFPRHETVERSSSLMRNKFDDICIIDQPEKRRLVGNQIKWVHQIF